MIYILEGVNGVGKSAAAKAIQAQAHNEFIPSWRPFRSGSDVHWGHTEDETGQMLRDFGVPLNTFVDDLYVADALSTLRPEHHVILDRSLPTAIAYGRIHQETWIDLHSYDIWNYWVNRLNLAGRVFWIQLQAPYEVTKERCEGRWCPNKDDWTALRRTYGRLIQRAPSSFRIQVIETQDKTPEAIAEQVLCLR